MAPVDKLKEMFRAAAERMDRAELIEVNAALSADLVVLKEALERQAAMIEKLQEQIGLNSKNSSKSPSSDGPEVPKGKGHGSGRKSKRKPGGQPGHEGQSFGPIPEDKVTKRVEVRPEACGDCGGRLAPAEQAPWRHPVWDLPAPISMLLTVYELSAGYCPCCRTTTPAKLPEGVTWSHFGPQLVAATGLLAGRFKLSDRMLQEFFETFYDFRVSLGSIVAMRKTLSDSLAKPHAEAHGFVQQQPVVHADETGWKEKAKRAWLWVATTLCVTVFLIRPRRWSEAAKELLHEEFSGILVSDRWSSYRWVDDRQRQLCWAHLLRDFHRIAGRDGAPGRLGRRMEKLGTMLFREWHRHQAGKIARATFQAYASRIRRPLRALLEQGARGRHARTAGTCKELLRDEAMMWTFARVEGVPPTNNDAERVLRPAVIKRKLSFGTQSPDGSRFVERILTTVTTLRQQRRNVLGWLAEACQAHMSGFQAPSLLPST